MPYVKDQDFFSGNTIEDNIGVVQNGQTMMSDIIAKPANFWKKFQRINA